MTGERELPGREISPDGGEEAEAAAAAATVVGASERERVGGAGLGVTNPTWRTLGSLTVRGGRRMSIGTPATGFKRERGGGSVRVLKAFRRMDPLGAAGHMTSVRFFFRFFFFFFLFFFFFSS